MTSKKWARIILIWIVLALIAGCSPNLPQPADQKVINVGMLLAKGGLGDRSFNDSAYAGLHEAQKRYALRFKTIDFTTEATNLENLREFARENYDLIVALGFENAAAIETVAREFPDRKFAILDAEVQNSNVAAIVYREQEGDFLMGVLAAMLTRSQKVGFIGGVDMAITRRIESGFRQGVSYQNPAVSVVTDLAGTFSDFEIGKKLALAQYAGGVDLIYNAAGRTGLGVIEAAKETGKLTLGTSGEQIYLAPGSVVGNRPKRLDSAMLKLIDEIQRQQFQAGVRSFGLKEDGLTLGPFDEKIVTPQMRERLEELRQAIINAKIIVKAESN